MSNNFYIRFNHKNIIPFNLKKKKLKVHANIIGSKPTNLYGFLENSEIKYSYYCFGINGLKKDNVFLIKKNLDRKLGVFFISNFNMVEGKWLFSKIYEQYYKNYLFLRKKKINLIRINLVMGHNYNSYNNIYIKYSNYINIYNLLKTNYIYNLFLVRNLNTKGNNYILYNFKKLKLLNNIKTIYILHINKYFKKNIKFYWFWHFYFKTKLLKKKIENQKPFGLIYKFKPYVKPKPNLFFTKKWYFIKNQNFLRKFYLIKKIINIIQFVKMNVAINKIYKINILYIFYYYYLYFNFIKLYFNDNNIKKRKKYIYIKKSNIKKFKYNILNLKKKKNLYIKYIKISDIKKKKNLFNNFFYQNLNKKFYKKFYLNFFKILKKKIIKFYNYKIFKKKKLLNYYNFNNFFINNPINEIWLKYKKNKNKNNIIKLYWLKKKDNNKFKKKYNYVNFYLLWLYYIIKKNFKYKKFF